MCWSLERWGEIERLKEGRAAAGAVHEEARRILADAAAQEDRRPGIACEPARAGAKSGV